MNEIPESSLSAWQAIRTLGEFLTSEQTFEVERLMERHSIFRRTLGVSWSRHS